MTRKFGMHKTQLLTPPLKRRGGGVYGGGTGGLGGGGVPLLLAGKKLSTGLPVTVTLALNELQLTENNGKISYPHTLAQAPPPRTPGMRVLGAFQRSSVPILR